jgi:hypothetical protein
MNDSSSSEFILPLSLIGKLNYPAVPATSLIRDIYSVTGGNDSLTVVFGWNVVIKYVPLNPSKFRCSQSNCS